MKASCIIPTFGRDVSVVVRTIESILALGDELVEYCAEIIVVDQNTPSLELGAWADGRAANEIRYVTCNVHSPLDTAEHGAPSGDVRLVHVVGLNPSLPAAKNYAAGMSRQDYIFIFDDDVIVNAGCLRKHVDVLGAEGGIGALAGREIVGPKRFQRNRFREVINSCAEKILPSPEGEETYKLNGRYVARVKPNSFIFCRFDMAGEGLVEADTVRGCYWSMKRDVFNEAGGFDENFQGALRDETDLCLKIKGLGYRICFQPGAYVLHERQPGGCDNVTASYNSLLAKYDNEFYFQFKHFLERSSIYYLVRLLPMAIEGLKRTWGISLFLHVQLTWNLFRIKRNRRRRVDYESTLRYGMGESGRVVKKEGRRLTKGGA